MIKFVVLACLCGVLLVEAQQIPMPQPPIPQPPSLPRTHHRVVRQMPGAGMMPGGGIPQGMNGGGGPGNLGMQGLGNIPDPTVWIAKGQEIASQFAKGRRRRHAMPQGTNMSDVN